MLERADLPPVIYELVLPERGSWEEFRDQIYPLLVRYLKAQRVTPEYPKHLVVAVFFKDQCHFVEGLKFMTALQEFDGLNSQALHFRNLRWLAE